MSGSLAPLIISAEAVREHLGRGERLMGIDLGAKTIGLALSDVGLSIATAAHTLRRSKFMADAGAIKLFAAKERVGALVVGLPLNMDGSEGARVQSVRSFLRALAPVLPLPVVLWDERLSTVTAARTLLEADLSRAKRAAVIDAAAASIILQGVLNRLRFLDRAADQSSSSSSS